ncbi:hypothetical protein EOD10_10605 [Mesorhizobium sp. M7A.T.Ca.TU.009.01.3.2]|nr:hypothetical protein EOD10_10605 [Mesorhizobium sp. M7A.T.Ca.TU.009.01.3.2]RUV10159.1 hypothetical protein EOD00_13405 [Mesorhizobium sp. M7A.T.Ca.TU.009.01.3.1]
MDHAVITRKAAHKSKGDSSVSPKNEAALIRAKEFEKFAAQQGEMVAGAEESAVILDYEAVAEIVRKGQELAQDEEAWPEFITLPFWTVEVKKGRPKPEDRPEAIRYMLRRYRGSSELQSKQASDRWRAVKVLLAEGVKPHRMAAILEKRGGYRGINRPNRNGQTSAKVAPMGKSKSEASICILEADFGQNIDWLTRLQMPCRVGLVGFIDELGVPLKMRIEKFARVKGKER